MQFSQIRNVFCHIDWRKTHFVWIRLEFCFLSHLFDTNYDGISVSSIILIAAIFIIPLEMGKVKRLFQENYNVASKLFIRFSFTSQLTRNNRRITIGWHARFRCVERSKRWRRGDTKLITNYQGLPVLNVVTVSSYYRNCDRENK